VVGNLAMKPALLPNDFIPVRAARLMKRIPNADAKGKLIPSSAAKSDGLCRHKL
jgi:hypothetical protein